MPIVNCRHFSGYKPCDKNPLCNDQCPSRDVPSKNILLIHLGALGAVVRSTSLLKSIHNKYQNCRLIWVTESPANQLLQNNPYIDYVYTTSNADLLELSSWDFEVALVVDKSRRAGGILRQISVKQIFGFQIEPYSGAVLPATLAATELWELGLDDHKKFYINNKPETQLLHEALDLGVWTRSEYNLPLTKKESASLIHRRQQWSIEKHQLVIGFNTGCSPTIPYKKWSVDYHQKIIRQLIVLGYKNIVLLGGPEDDLRNQEIAKGLPIFQSYTRQGLRDGLVSVAACDIVISGDSLGMHMAIAMKKFVIAWFGPTCKQEIDLYNRGVAIISKATCAPCWKRTCDKLKLCYDQVELAEVLLAIKKGEQWYQEQSQNTNPFLLSKQPFLEISS